MPKRVSYGGTANHKKKTASQMKKDKAQRARDRSKQVDSIYNDLGMKDNGYTRDEAELLLRSGALYEVMAKMDYDSTQLEEFVENESDIVDIALNMARRWERKDHFTQKQLDDLAHMSRADRERLGQIAREELEDWRNGITFGF